MLDERASSPDTTPPFSTRWKLYARFHPAMCRLFVGGCGEGFCTSPPYLPMSTSGSWSEPSFTCPKVPAKQQQQQHKPQGGESCCTPTSNNEVFYKRQRRPRTVSFFFSEDWVRRGVTAMDFSPSVNPSELWFSKKDIARNKLDLSRTVQAIQSFDGSTWDKVLVKDDDECEDSLLVKPCHASLKELGKDESGNESPDLVSANPKVEDKSDDKFCWRGCERYYSLLQRQAIVRLLLETVTEAQLSVDDEGLRLLSESMTQPCRDLAVWHAKLNAYKCWGKLPGPPPIQASATV